MIAASSGLLQRWIVSADIFGVLCILVVLDYARQTSYTSGKGDYVVAVCVSLFPPQRLKISRINDTEVD
jgi:hypothetical protein